MNERIHKSFRVWLFETGIRVQQTDFTDPEAGHGITLELQQILKAIDRKCLLEARFFFPALALQAPFSVPLLEEQKREVQMHAHGLERLVCRYGEPGTAGHYAKTGMAIQAAFCRLVSLMMIYTNQQDTLFRESGEFEEKQTASVEEIVALLSNGTADVDSWIAFVLRGMGEKEIASWLEAKTGTPGIAKWAMLRSTNPGMFMKLRRQQAVHNMEIAA